MDFELGAPKVLELVLKLKQYPILSREIRERMREEIFRRGVITKANFEKEVRQRAHASQLREGYVEAADAEPAEVWELRLALIREDLTDFYFAHNCPEALFEALVKETVSKRRAGEEVVLTVNPELAPWALLFTTGEQYEKLPPEERKKVAHHLRESIVVLTKGMLSDQLDYVGIAREIFSIKDLKEIRARRVGRGKIGGKAAGLLLASKVLNKARQGDGENACASIPDSWFIAADVYYEFQALNGLTEFMNQKYRPQEEVAAAYPQLKARYLGGNFPPYVIEALTAILKEVESDPLVVRSSSLLEDNFGFSFAGKYESVFLANHGSFEERLQSLKTAVAEVYASTQSPDALAYRKKMGLIDYDERMAVLIQRVVGFHYRDYYFPACAGVAFSKNPFRWHPMIRREDGMARIVLGLGTRAVDRLVGDYPRIIALSHPLLRPESDRQRAKYSQKQVDLIDLKSNRPRTVYRENLLGADFPGLGLCMSIIKDGLPQRLLSRFEASNPEELIPSFDGLLQDTDFIQTLRGMLTTLEEAYRRPVDIEFAVRILPSLFSEEPHVRITLLQCRPLSERSPETAETVPENLDERDILFISNRLVPDGTVRDIRKILLIDPRQYDRLQSSAEKTALARVVGKVNAILEWENFILLGPGRWGSSNLDLGVKVSYADIHNAKMLVELAFAKDETVPELSYGTHFFQDLVEAGIHTLSLFPDDSAGRFNDRFFSEAPNSLSELLPKTETGIAKLIDLERIEPGLRLTVVMNGDQEKAVGFLTHAK